MTVTKTGPFTEAELGYLATQMLGRLATVAPDGTMQNNPVSFRYNPATGTIDIGGHQMGASRKFHNVETNEQVAFVVDDVVSLDPWRVRGVEIRGRAEALRDEPPPRSGFSAEIIRIHPRRILSWGLDAALPGLQRRTVSRTVTGQPGDQPAR
jgi:pyridoxamine 5'-phosphate oxidase family protein